jgi:1-acyl-sn-glycerol-3-phosphate acyltransferase
MRRLLRQLFLTIFHNILMKNFLRFIVGVQFSDNHPLKENMQFVYVSNHNSHLDTAALIASLPPSIIADVHPVAAYDYFGRNLFTRFIAWCFNAKFIYRTRDAGVPNSLEIMSDLIKTGKSIILFPEGTRGEPEKMEELKPGIGVLLARNPHVPFIPAFLEGMGKALPRGNALLVPYNCYVNIGSPVHVYGMGVEQILNMVETKILGLKRTKG